MKFNFRNPASFFLRIGLAYVFIFVAVASFINPSSYAHFVPKWLTQMIPLNIFLPLWAIFEVGLTIWLLSGKKSFYASLTAATIIFFLTVLNLKDFGILFRNVAIFYAALALAALSLD